MTNFGHRLLRCARNDTLLVDRTVRVLSHSSKGNRIQRLQLGRGRDCASSRCSMMTG
jgi:hypothetical protein